MFEANITKLKVDHPKKESKKQGLSRTGSKKELLDRLNKAMVDKVLFQSENTLEALTQEAVFLDTAKWVLTGPME